MNMSQADAIENLVGEEINAISFVMDYLEIHFNGAILRSMSSPKVTRQGQTKVFPESGSRDALCALIGCIVTEIRFVEGSSLQLFTDRGLQLELPLGTSKGESLHFVPRGPLPGGYGPVQIFD